MIGYIVAGKLLRTFVASLAQTKRRSNHERGPPANHRHAKLGRIPHIKEILLSGKKPIILPMLQGKACGDRRAHGYSQSSNVQKNYRKQRDTWLSLPGINVALCLIDSARHRRFAFTPTRVASIELSYIRK
jgi:hypothetical protein